MSESDGRSTTPRACTPCSEDHSSPSTSVMSSRENDEASQAEKQLLLKSFGEDILLPEEELEECKCASPTKDVGTCDCCSCPLTKCRCKMIGREAFDEWRKNRPLGQMPAVLESTHPLMQRFQDTLKKFLERENLIAEEEILNVREELRLSKLAYDKDLEAIYTNDHDTNAQRVLIEDYEATLAQKVKDRIDEEQRAREANEKFKKTKEILEKNIIAERETTEELEALTNLCRQLEKWQEETESDLTISKAMSDKMKKEKKAMAEEKRELDVLIFGLSNEVWKLESKLELLQKQLEIKGEEMDKVNDKVTAYATELEDLELDKRRLVSLWNSVLVNIKQRDNVYDSVREDYRELRENYRTLVTNLSITKKVTEEEMNRGKELAMNKDKLIYDMMNTTKTFDHEDAKRIQLETQIAELTESLEMAERDENMLKMENKTMMNILNTTEKEFDHKTEFKMKLENEILHNLQECLLNDKAVEAMANGIKKMREMSRKQEISLVAMENQHAKVMLDIEIYRNRQAKNNQILEENSAKVKAKEKEIEDLEEKYNQKALLYMRKQRELDIVTKKYTALKEIFDMKSPQERRIDELESQIKALRERTEGLQHEWLRLQGHVVKLTTQHHRIVTDINLINKQIQICEQKTMRLQAESDSVKMERTKLDRLLRSLRGDLEVLERNRKDATEKNDCLEKTNAAVTHEYAANLRDAEEEIIEIDDAIEALDREKINLTQELDRVQKEALIWQRKGILAVDLKKNMQTAKSAVGEIGQMKTEIHRMEVRREQLRRTSEKLADDLALCITRRETAMDKSRAAAAVEKAHGSSGQTSQSVYHHKLRLAKADVARVTKELADAKAHMENLQKEQDRLDDQIKETIRSNQQLEEHIAQLLRETVELDKQKQWLLERVVRNQRLGKDMMKVVKKQSVKVRKPKNVVFEEFEQARALNDRISYIAETLSKEFPYLEDKMEVIMNTLNIYSPSGSPRLTEEGGQCNVVLEEQDEEECEYVAEKPLCP